MPSTPGFLQEYPCIRVDRFDNNENENDDHGPVELYLLTHIHTDHLVGLQSKGHLLPAKIYCSQASKDALLKLEPQGSRVANLMKDSATGHQRPYARLLNKGSDPRNGTQSKYGEGLVKQDGVDLLTALPYNTPTKIKYLQSVITLTLIESNHMHGGTMFLIEGDNGAVLHTGDLRAEKHWSKALVRNPAIQRYVAWNRRDLDHYGELKSLTPGEGNSGGADDVDWAEHIDNHQDNNPKLPPLNHQGEESNTRSSPTSLNLSQKEVSNPTLRLRNIYLDTEAYAAFYRVLSKEEAARDMVSLIRFFPQEAQFFLNAWTWGYEDLLKGCAKAFGKKVHVDFYKNSIYTSFQSEDPFLKSIVTTDEKYETRFHACEKGLKCEKIKYLETFKMEEGDASRRTKRKFIVYVSPVEISVEAWEVYLREMRTILQDAQDGKKDWPAEIKVPISRHSTLPELLHLVNLFRPHTVTPNTIKQGSGSELFFFCQLFHHVLSDAGSGKFLLLGKRYVGEEKWNRRVEKLDQTMQELKFEDESKGVQRGAERWSYFREALIRVVFKDPLPARLLERSHHAVSDQVERVEDMKFSDDQDSDEEMDQERSNFVVTQSGYDADVSGRPAIRRENLRNGYEADVSESTPSLQQPNEDHLNFNTGKDTSRSGFQTQTQKLDAEASRISPQNNEFSRDGRTKDQSTKTHTPSLPRATTALTEELADQYFDATEEVVGKTFTTSKNRLGSVERWLKVRKKRGDDARLVENWFKEKKGIEPPPWNIEETSGPPSKVISRVSAPNSTLDPIPATAPAPSAIPSQAAALSDPPVDSSSIVNQNELSHNHAQQTSDQSSPAQPSTHPATRRPRNSTPAPATMGKDASDLASEETQASEITPQEPAMRPKNPFPGCLQSLRSTSGRDQIRGVSSLSSEINLGLIKTYESIIEFFDTTQNFESYSDMGFEKEVDLDHSSRGLLTCLMRDLRLLIRLFEFRFPSKPIFDRSSKRKSMIIKARFELLVSIVATQVLSGNSMVCDFDSAEIGNLFELVLKASEAGNLWHREVYLPDPVSHNLKHFVELERTRIVLRLCLINRSDKLARLGSGPNSERILKILNQTGLLSQSENDRTLPLSTSSRIGSKVEASSIPASRKRRIEQGEEGIEKLKSSGPPSRSRSLSQQPRNPNENLSADTQRSHSESYVDTQEVAVLAKKLRKEDEERRQRRKV